MVNLFEQKTKKRILLVEDSKDIQLLVQAFLGFHNVDLEVASDGKGALNSLDSSEFDLILMDLNIPIISGKDCMREIKLRGLKVPVVAFSAALAPDNFDECIEIGFSDILRKPFTEQQLMNVIDRNTNNFESNNSQVTEKNEIFKDPEVLLVYAKNLNEQVEKMESFCQFNDWSGLKKSAHRLKGSSYCFGKLKIAEICEDIERSLEESENINFQRIQKMILEIKKDSVQV